MICAYAAIGLFMSTLTSYQVVAAVGTLAVLAVLNYIGNVGQDIPFVRDITYWLSISGRADTFFKGMICSEDLLLLLISYCSFYHILDIKITSRTNETFHSPKYSSLWKCHYYNTHDWLSQCSSGIPLLL